jgi:hypothetical protein
MNDHDYLSLCLSPCLSHYFRQPDPLDVKETTATYFLTHKAWNSSSKAACAMCQLPCQDFFTWYPPQKKNSTKFSRQTFLSYCDQDSRKMGPLSCASATTAQPLLREPVHIYSRRLRLHKTGRRFIRTIPSTLNYSLRSFSYWLTADVRVARITIYLLCTGGALEQVSVADRDGERVPLQPPCAVRRGRRLQASHSHGSQKVVLLRSVKFAFGR